MASCPRFIELEEILVTPIMHHVNVCNIASIKDYTLSSKIVIMDDYDISIVTPDYNDVYSHLQAFQEENKYCSKFVTFTRSFNSSAPDEQFTVNTCAIKEYYQFTGSYITDGWVFVVKDEPYAVYVKNITPLLPHLPVSTLPMDLTIPLATGD